MSPKVSILLPNLDNRPYLEERIRSIKEQTISNWELIVVDSHSTDGAWEFFVECAAKDDRIKIFKSEEKGIYINFNTCVRLAQGDYVYFATSDDSMAPNALEEMVKALDERYDCDIAHCKLRIIDEDNKNSDLKLWDNFFIVRYFGDLIDRRHIRKAPHDGLLHFSGITVYTSLTQLLIRRSLFDRIGLFPLDYGPIGDFEWVMRATLVANTVHIPEYLATWRFHSNQATTDDRLNIAKASGKFIKMARHATHIALKLYPSVIDVLNLKKWMVILEKEKLYYELKRMDTPFKKKLVFLKWFLKNHRLAVEFQRVKRENRNFVSQEDFLDYIKSMIKEYKLEKNLVILN
jgi:glycosyltransferase involved in cell wall biosynthesis